MLVGRHHPHLKRFSTYLPSLKYNQHCAAVGSGSKQPQLNGFVGLGRVAFWKEGGVFSESGVWSVRVYAVASSR